MSTIRKILGGLLIAIGFLFNWVLRLALFIVLCFYVVFGFIDGGLWAGLLSILIGGICTTIAYFLFGFIGMGLVAAGGALWGD